MRSFSSRLQYLAFAVLLAALVLPASAQNRLALITELSGTVELARSGSSTFDATEWGTPLYQGDRIRTASGAQAVLLFSDNNLMTVSGGNTYTVGGAAAAGGRSVSSSVISSDTDLTLHRAGAGEVEVLGGLRNSLSREAIAVQSPVNTRIASTRPMFSWVSLDGFDSYKITLQSAGKEIWSAETDETWIAYPENAPALGADETYFWRVTGENLMDSEDSKLVSFQVLSGEDQAAYESALAELNTQYPDAERGDSYLFLLGTLQAKHQVYDGAIASFERIAELHPGSAGAHQILGSLYAEVGRVADAIAATERAAQLRSDE